MNTVSYLLASLCMLAAPWGMPLVDSVLNIQNLGTVYVQPGPHNPVKLPGSDRSLPHPDHGQVRESAAPLWMVFQQCKEHQRGVFKERAGLVSGVGVKGPRVGSA